MSVLLIEERYSIQSEVSRLPSKIIYEIDPWGLYVVSLSWCVCLSKQKVTDNDKDTSLLP
jgi:hypothetical protein